MNKYDERDGELEPYEPISHQINADAVLEPMIDRIFAGKLSEDELIDAVYDVFHLPLDLGAVQEIYSRAAALRRACKIAVYDAVVSLCDTLRAGAAPSDAVSEVERLLAGD